MIKQIVMRALLAVLLSSAALQDTRHERPENPTFLTWQDYGRIADLIARLPSWNDQDDLTVSEWQSVAALADALQNVTDEEIKCAFVTYMTRYGSNHDQLDAARTKPILLLRTMFDTSRPRPDTSDERLKWWRTQGYQPCGGFSFAAVEVANRWDEDGLPMKWSKGKPTLATKRFLVPANQGGGQPRHSYQPHIDFMYLKEAYEHRDLTGSFDAMPGNWRTLAKQAGLPDNAEVPRRSNESSDQ